MVSFRSDLQTAAAQAATDILTDLGIQISYQNRGNAAVLVYAWAGPETKTEEPYNKTITEMLRCTFTIPMQTGFPPTTGISVFDQITFNSLTWSIETYKTDSIQAIYYLDAKAPNIRQIGKIN